MHFGFHHSEQLEKLTKFGKRIKKLEWWRIVGDKKKYWGNYLHFPHGIQLAIESFVELYVDVKEHYKVKSLMGSHTDQNCAESGFGQIRFMGGDNADPNAFELMQRVSKWTVKRIMDYDPEFDILSLKEPLAKDIQDFCEDGLYENEREDPLALDENDEDDDDNFEMPEFPDDPNEPEMADDGKNY